MLTTRLTQHASFSIAIACAAAGCGLVDLDRGGEDDEDTQGTDQPVEATPPVATGPAIHASNGVVYRWSDGDWIARVTVIYQNPTSQTVVARRDAFLAEGMTAWAQASTFPEQAEVAAGQSVTGDVAWYSSRTERAPARVAITNGDFQAQVALTPVHLPPPAGTALAGPPSGVVTIRANGGGTTWRHTDQDHIVKVPLAITNGTTLPVEVPAHYFHSRLPGDQATAPTGSWWTPEVSIADPLVIPPGATAEGFLSWYFADELPVPEQLIVSVGATAFPLASTEVQLVETPRP